MKTSNITGSNSSTGSHNHGLAQTLMQVLLDGSSTEAIWWLPGGKEFAINADLFPSKVLEVYFPDCKYASFIRRVHKMGFSRETRALKKVYGAQIPAHAVAFRHPKFLKDHPELAEEIRQQQSPGKGEGKKITKVSVAKKRTKKMQQADSSVLSSRVASPPVAPASAPVSGLSFSPQPVVATSVPSMEAAKKQPVTSPMGAGISTMTDANLLEYLQSLRQQREQQELFLQRMEEERLRREQEEMLYHRLEEERQLQILLAQQARQQQQQQQQLEMAQEMALRQQLLAMAASGGYQPAAPVQEPLYAPTNAFEAAPVQDDALLRLQLLQHMQQQAASFNNFMF